MKLRLESTFAWRWLLCATLGLVWLGAIGAGLGALAWYDNASAAPQEFLAEWPSGSAIHRSEQEKTLILFAHPRCPCTRASLGELEKIVAHCQGTITPWVVFFKPDGAEPGWEQTDLWRTASAIPGVHVLCDVGGTRRDAFMSPLQGRPCSTAPAASGCSAAELRLLGDMPEIMPVAPRSKRGRPAVHRDIARRRCSAVRSSTRPSQSRESRLCR